jgi:hypothetical protein
MADTVTVCAFSTCLGRLDWIRLDAIYSFLDSIHANVRGNHRVIARRQQSQCVVLWCCSGRGFVWTHRSPPWVGLHLCGLLSASGMHASQKPSFPPPHRQAPRRKAPLKIQKSKNPKRYCETTHRSNVVFCLPRIPFCDRERFQRNPRIGSHLNSNQFKSIQFNSIQFNSIQSNTDGFVFRGRLGSFRKASRFLLADSLSLQKLKVVSVVVVR